MFRKTLYITVALITVWWIGGCEKGNPVVAVGDSPRIFPLAKGNTWTYDQTIVYTTSETTITRTCPLDSPITFNGLKWYGMNNFCVDCDVPVGMSPTPLVCVLFARNGMKLLALRSIGLMGGNPEVILDFPLTPGKTWTIFSSDTTYVIATGDTIHSRQLSRRYMRAVEPVTVPAGTFWACYHIEDSTSYLSTVARAGGARDTALTLMVTHEWFAGGVGLVRQIVNYFNSGDFVDLRSTREELRSYSLLPDDGP